MSEAKSGSNGWVDAASHGFWSRTSLHSSGLLFYRTDGGPSGLSDADIALVTCSPLDPFVANSLRLIIQAIKVDPPAAPAPSAEQKL